MKGDPMTKAELIEEMANKATITKDQAAKALESLLEGIQGTLKKKNGKVNLVGFGSFNKIHQKSRNGRNPATGEKIEIPARSVIKFKPGKKLKEAIQ
jgi:DNA-binding protein HU-beta